MSNEKQEPNVNREKKFTKNVPLLPPSPLHLDRGSLSLVVVDVAVAPNGIRQREEALLPLLGPVQSEVRGRWRGQLLEREICTPRTISFSSSGALHYANSSFLFRLVANGVGA